MFETLLPNCSNLNFFPVSAFDTLKLYGYEITPLKANHATKFKNEQALHYYFKGEKSIFFGFDGFEYIF